MAKTTHETEAVGVFHDADSLQAAVDELLSRGFDRAELSVLAGHDTVARTLGRDYRDARELEDDPAVPTTAFVPRETLGDAEGAVIGTFLYLPAVIGTVAVVASGGTLAAAIAAAAIGGGAGAGIGALLSVLIERHHARYLADQLERGGLLLWVRTRDAAHEAKAQEVLKRHSAGDVHLHKLPKLVFSTEG
jgi:hypothetical protein